MKTYVDLHIHTDASDSTNTLNDVLENANKNGVKVISITDHNTLAAYKACISDLQITIVPGVELTAIYDESIQMHILGYGIDVNDSRLNKKLETLQYGYLRAMYRMMFLINKKFNINIQKELEQRSLKIKRKNICALMMELTSTNDPKTIYENYLDYHLYDLNVSYMSATDAILLIKGAGGIPVLAHPQRLEVSREKLEEILQKLKGVGLLGIEVYHPSQEGMENAYLKMANKYSLLVSGGSDNHGRYLSKNEIGYVNQKRIELESITLLERIGKNNEKIPRT